MELWIRSQDRTTLIRSYEIYISEQRNTYLIRAKRTSHILGVYNTFERALEILDEIQIRLINLQLVRLEEKGQARKDARINDELKCIYEMPKE